MDGIEMDLELAEKFSALGFDSVKEIVEFEKTAQYEN